MVLTEALERRKQKLAADEEEAEDAAPAPAEGSSPIKPTLLLNKHEDLPPLAPSTNPLFPNAIVKRPPNTHARGPVTQPTNKPAAAPATPRVHTGKNAPVGDCNELTDSSRRRKVSLPDPRAGASISDRRRRPCPRPLRRICKSTSSICTLCIHVE